VTYRELRAFLATVGDHDLDQPVRVRLREHDVEGAVMVAMEDRNTERLYLSDSPLGFGCDNKEKLNYED
jgi:hypothetical protein